MAKKPSAEVKFKYGTCKTDHKPGDEIREYYRQTDYMNEEPYASRVKEMLEQMGLPQPKKDEIFRGTHHDLLFLDSHGVVLRIGPTDVEDLMNPAVIQPLGWIEDKNNLIKHGLKNIPFTVAIYPGIELYNDFKADKNRPQTSTNLFQFLQDTKQNTDDLNAANIGIIRVKDDNGTEVGVEMLLDPDNSYNAGTDATTSQTKSSRFALAQKEIKHKGDAMEATVTSMFPAAENAAHYQRAFEVHQPLRRMFWDAFENAAPDGKPDKNILRSFWKSCAATLNNPMTHFHKTATYQQQGEHKFKRSVQSKPVETVLYRPWTGNSRDSVAAVKKALENAKKPPLRRMASKFIATLTEDDSVAAKKYRHPPKILRQIEKIGLKINKKLIAASIFVLKLPPMLVQQIITGKGADKLAKSVQKQWKKTFQKDHPAEHELSKYAEKPKNAPQKSLPEKKSVAQNRQSLKPPLRI